VYINKCSYHFHIGRLAEYVDRQFKETAAEADGINTKVQVLSAKVEVLSVSMAAMKTDMAVMKVNVAMILTLLQA